jgi:hypothetical protein
LPVSTFQKCLDSTTRPAFASQVYAPSISLLFPVPIHSIFTGSHFAVVAIDDFPYPSSPTFFQVRELLSLSSSAAQSLENGYDWQEGLQQCVSFQLSIPNPMYAETIRNGI